MKGAVDGGEPRLNLGCGTVAPEGWTNIDNAPEAILAKTPIWIQNIIETVAQSTGRNVSLQDWSGDIHYADLTERSIITQYAPAEAIYTGHFLEHLPRETAREVCESCRDTLKPGGVFRVCVPDLESYTQAYLNRDTGFFDDQTGPIADRYLSRMMLHSFHEWMYDGESLMVLLEDAGFATNSIAEQEFREGRCPDLDRVEVHEPPRSIYVEAVAD